jgi:hypothetical protein
MNKFIVLLLISTFSFLFGDDNVVVRHGDQQVAQGEFIGTYMNHVHILMGNKIYYYACDDIIAITYSRGGGYAYDCSKNTVTADILFPPELDPMTGEWTQMLPDVFNPDIPKPAVQKATPVVQKPAAKVEAGGDSSEEDFVIIDGVKYARVAPEKEAAQAEPKAGVSVRAILPGQKSAIKSLSTAAGFTNSDLNTYLMQNYGQTLDGLSHKQGTNVINKFQAGSVSKPAQIRNNQATYNNAGSAPQFNVCHQAGLDAVASTSPLWYGGGIIYIIGVPAYFLSKPQPNQYAISNIAPEEQLLYMECYKSAAQNERGKRMALGCGGYLLFAMMAVSM